jgi:diguanylate cyclase (GGDEF)-like protein
VFRAETHQKQQTQIPTVPREQLRPGVLGRLQVSAWFVLTLGLLFISASILAALLLSSARQSINAETRIVFEASGSDRAEDFRQAAINLSERLATSGSSTSLSPEGRFWLYSELQTKSFGPVILEIRHLRPISATFELLPESRSESNSQVAWHHVKGGIALDLPARTSGTYRLIGTVAPAYPMVLKLFAWDPPEFERSIEGFNRMGGALAGACAVLALTMGLLALRNRDYVAVMFGLTVLLMLRVAAFNSGWDLHWLGAHVPTSLAPLLIRATLPLAAIAQTSLFVMLFRRELLVMGLHKPTAVFLSTFGLLLLWSPFAEHATFLRTWWWMTAPGAAWLLYVLARVVTKTNDRSARLYAFSLGVTLAGMIAEIAYFWGLWDTRVSAALLGVLIGSAINAAAVAERLYTERARAMESQRREIIALREKDDIFQSSQIPLFEFDSNGDLRHSNLAFSEFFADRFRGNSNTFHWNELFGHLVEFRVAIGEPGSLESVRFDRPVTPRPENSSVYVDLRWTREGNEIRGSLQDITERELARQAMQRLVSNDQLTGVLNVHGLLGKFSSNANYVALGAYSLALFDIARFEAINELFGHDAGDLVLKTFASRLSDQCRDPEVVARVGADTFVVVLPDLQIEEAGRRVRDIALHCTSHPVAVGGKAVAVAVTVGVVAPSDGVSIEQALGASLRTTQRAKRKRSGPVTIELDTRETLGNYLNEKRLLGRITDRLPTENFFQLMQPIINLRNPRGSFAAEALIRMRSENGEIIPPGMFIAAAERNGLMPEIDRWTLRTACEWLSTHQNLLLELDYLTVNVSGVSLNDVQFHSDVRAILADFPQESRKLCFEITESIAVSDIEATTRFTEQLRTLGAKVALDDFGAGYTSFGYLRTIPAEILKVDGEIIKSVATDSSSAAILRAIRDIAGDLGMRCVAEFVTDFRTLRALRELDIDFGQGFALSRPISPSILTTATCGADLIGDQEVVRYLDACAGRNFTRSALRATR